MDQEFAGKSCAFVHKLTGVPRIKLFSLIDLPEELNARFRTNMTLIEGRLSDVGGVRPDALLCSIGANRLDQSAIEGLPSSVRAIATYSVGHDHIDLSAAAARGIAVFNTPGVLSDAVADNAMLLILGAARRATESIALLRSGQWTGWTPGQLIGVGLEGKMLGILGMGNIGRKVAWRARAFGMSVAYHNRTPLGSEDGLYMDDPYSLIEHADVILLAWPSTAETRRFINASTLARAKRSAILVNIGRGDLVEDDALIAALRVGTIRAAGLDVFDGEPALHPDYLQLPNAFLLPHIGSSTWEARVAMADLLCDAIVSHAAGGTPANRIV